MEMVFTFDLNRLDDGSTPSIGELMAAQIALGPYVLAPSPSLMMVPMWQAIAARYHRYAALAAAHCNHPHAVVVCDCEATRCPVSYTHLTLPTIYSV